MKEDKIKEIFKGINSMNKSKSSCDTKEFVASFDNTLSNVVKHKNELDVNKLKYVTQKLVTSVKDFKHDCG